MSSFPIDTVDPIPTAPVNVEIPVVNTSPSELSVIPEPTLTSPVVSTSPLAASTKNLLAALVVSLSLKHSLRCRRRLSCRSPWSAYH